MNTISVSKVLGAYEPTPIAKASSITVTEKTQSTISATPSATLEISTEARIANAAAANLLLSRYEKSGDKDIAADVLADKIGGVSSVKIPSFGTREFDAVSEKYVAQTSNSKSVAHKPRNFLDEDHRNQIKATLEAAKQESKIALFVFTKAVPHLTVVKYIADHATQIGAQYDIRDIDKPIL